MTCSSSFPGFFISRQGGWKGRGQQHTLLLSPGVLDNDEGAGWHICAPLIPTHSIIDRGWHETHMLALFGLVSPSSGGIMLSMA